MSRWLTSSPPRDSVILKIENGFFYLEERKWKKAKAYDLILVPGDSFGCPGYFRMAYCIPTEKVERSLTAFEKLVKEYK